MLSISFFFMDGLKKRETIKPTERGVQHSCFGRVSSYFIRYGCGHQASDRISGKIQAGMTGFASTVGMLQKMRNMLSEGRLGTTVWPQ